jgi:hypothetical protein
LGVVRTDWRSQVRGTLGLPRDIHPFVFPS